MKNINVPVDKEELQAEILLLKERNRELEDELFHFKNILAMKNDEKNDEKSDIKLMKIYEEILDFRVSFEEFIKNKKLNDLKEELNRTNDDIKWVKGDIESLYNGTHYKIKNFKDIK